MLQAYAAIRNVCAHVPVGLRLRNPTLLSEMTPTGVGTALRQRYSTVAVGSAIISARINLSIFPEIFGRRVALKACISPIVPMVLLKALALQMALVAALKNRGSLTLTRFANRIWG